jgi:Rrf2 family protein
VAKKAVNQMLSFTRKTDYALISLAHLASAAGNSCSAREIATNYGMPLPLVMNILKSLAQHELIKSERGPRGGYQLAKLPADITLHDIITAVDGPVALVYCLDKVVGRNGRGTRSGGCELTPRCPVQKHVHGVHHRLVGFLKEVTLAEMTGASTGRRCELCDDHKEVRHEIANLPA